MIAQTSSTMSKLSAKDPSSESPKASPAPSTGDTTPTSTTGVDSNSLETAYASDKVADDSSKLRTFLSILRR